MNVRITAIAERDLEQIAAHIAKEDSVRATLFVHELRDVSLSSAEGSLHFPLVRQ